MSGMTTHERCDFTPMERFSLVCQFKRCRFKRMLEHRMTQEKPKLHLYKVSPSTSKGGVEPDFIGPAHCSGMITKLSNLTRFGIPAMGAFELSFDSKLSSLTRFGIPAMGTFELSLDS